MAIKVVVVVPVVVAVYIEVVVDSGFLDINVLAVTMIKADEAKNSCMYAVTA